MIGLKRLDIHRPLVNHMKASIILITYCILVNNCYAFSLLGGFKGEIKKMQDSQEKNFSDIQAGINSNKIKLDKIENTLNFQATAMAKVQAGFDKSQTAGRDIHTNITNDPILLKYMIGGLLMIIMYLLRDNMAGKKWLRNMIKSKEEYKRKYESINGSK